MISRNDRVAAIMQDSFVVFLIGMRINNLLLAQKWLPVAMAMPRMIRELSAHPEMGFLHAEPWFGRTTIMLQYWRSIEHLLAYARNRESAHWPAWRDFNRAAGANGTVGIWHETYLAGPDSYENVYVNMPPFGLGKIGKVLPATGRMQSAASRTGANPGGRLTRGAATMPIAPH